MNLSCGLLHKLFCISLRESLLRPPTCLWSSYHEVTWSLDVSNTSQQRTTLFNLFKCSYKVVTSFIHKIYNSCFKYSSRILVCIDPTITSLTLLVSTHLLHYKESNLLTIDEMYLVLFSPLLLHRICNFRQFCLFFV